VPRGARRVKAKPPAAALTRSASLGIKPVSDAAEQRPLVRGKLTKLPIQVSHALAEREPRIANGERRAGGNGERRREVVDERPSAGGVHPCEPIGASK
jgi:hypothetical protein